MSKLQPIQDSSNLQSPIFHQLIVSPISATEIYRNSINGHLKLQWRKSPISIKAASSVRSNLQSPQVHSFSHIQHFRSEISDLKFQKHQSNDTLSEINKCSSSDGMFSPLLPHISIKPQTFIPPCFCRLSVSVSVKYVINLYTWPLSAPFFTAFARSQIAMEFERFRLHKLHRIQGRST